MKKEILKLLRQIFAKQKKEIPLGVEAAGLDTTMEKAYKDAGVKLSYMKKSDFDAWLAQE